jgi:hypothetical protein
VITEENADYGSLIGSSKAPYLNRLATTYGLATRMNAGYPAGCPSLASYILMTSGDTHGICDDGPPSAHPLTGDSIFTQVARSGRQWRGYAESMPGPCAAGDSANGVYLVRHAPAPYYLAEASRCSRWDVPLGSPDAGALHDDVTAGTLPAYAFVTPDACHDMHGAPPCPSSKISNADAWLARWLPMIIAGPDFAAGRLVVFITWDEASSGSDNHIATLVISPTTHHVLAADPWTSCSMLRTHEDLLGLPPLGCATTAPSMAAAFAL